MKKGFTLTEILIVIAILMLIFLIVLANIRNQVAKAHDVQRKADLNKIQKSLEEYYNDKQTYPPDANAFLNCGSGDLSPYLVKILCDPVNKTPYKYVLGNPTAKDGYVVCAKLENRADSDITRIGCDPIKGCGWVEGYNYCVASGMLAVSADGLGGSGGSGGGPIGTPTPTAVPGIWACTPNGDCNAYADPVGAGCPHTYFQRGCTNNGVSMCGDPANRCTNY
jgi:prepilin-type N-terminal cleavage/methylation domain-containing protein